MERRAAVLRQERSSQGGDADNRVTVDARARDKPALVGLLPDRKLRTRRVPSFDYVGVSALLDRDVFQKIDDQGINGVGTQFISGGRIFG